MNKIKEFDKCEYKTDKDIKLLILWFTPDIRKNMADLGRILRELNRMKAC